MKKTIFLLLGVASALCSCTSSKVEISGKLLGLSPKTVYLEQNSASGKVLIDSITLAPDGSYRFELSNAPATPAMYNLIYCSERVPLLLCKGDKVTVNSLGSLLANYTVSGSKESELLRQFTANYVSGAMALTKKMGSYAQAEDEQERRTIAQEYTAKYREIKRKQISFIVSNKSNLAAVYALYQRLPGEQYLVGADSDIIYFRTVADAISNSYPTSPFLLSLRNDVARMEAQISLMKSIEQRNYPELEAFDMYGNSIKLSSLDGNVILVDFWSAERGSNNHINADLKEVYNKYEERGFRVYQVSVDTSKATWINAVQAQRLPWVSVCDFKGQASPLLGLYNVHKLPANYLIGRDGQILGKDLYGEDLTKKLEEVL